MKSTMVLVELRKSVNTRAGKGLLLTALGVIAIFAMISATTLSGAQIDVAEMLRFAAAPLFILMPTVAMISVTTEWTTRSAMTTFLLNPRRSQVAVSKLLAGWILSIGALIVAAGLCWLIGGLVAAATGSRITFEAGALLGSFTYCLISIVALNLLAMAIGSIVISTALGVAIFFLFTAGIDGLVGLVFPAWSSYLSFNAGLDAIANISLTGSNALPSVIAVAFWLAVPAVIGLQLFRTREIR